MRTSTGSLVALAAAVDSIGDAGVSLINKHLQRISRLRPDKEHPFGHGGVQVIGGLAPTLLAGLGVYVAYFSP